MSSQDSTPFADSTNSQNSNKRAYDDEELTPSGRSKNFGIQHEADPTVSQDDFTAEQRRWLDIYQYLKTKLPHFDERIVDVNDERWKDNNKVFKEGLAAARSDDIASLKGVVIDWITAAPYNASTTDHPLARNIKTNRGFYNPVIGQLLCPTDVDWTDLTTQQGLRDGTLTVDASPWPNFLYANGRLENPNDIWQGLFRHPLLIKTLKHIYTSPSSVDGANGTRGTRATKAALNGMTRMTVGAIADASLKLRHSLSSNSIFNRNDDAANEAFYYGLLEALEHPKAAAKVQDLLAFYNKLIFPGQAAMVQAPATSALARMRAQLAASPAAA